MENPSEEKFLLEHPLHERLVATSLPLRQGLQEDDALLTSPTPDQTLPSEGLLEGSGRLPKKVGGSAEVPQAEGLLGEPPRIKSLQTPSLLFPRAGEPSRRGGPFRPFPLPSMGPEPGHPLPPFHSSLQGTPTLFGPLPLTLGEKKP